MHASQPGERSKQHAVRGQILCVMLRSAALFIYLFIDFNITVINYQVSLPSLELSMAQIFQIMILFVAAAVLFAASTNIITVIIH